MKPYKITQDHQFDYGVVRRTDDRHCGGVYRPHWHGNTRGAAPVQPIYSFTQWTAYDAQSQRIGNKSYPTRAEAAAVVWQEWEANQ